MTIENSASPHDRVAQFEKMRQPSASILRRFVAVGFVTVVWQFLCAIGWGTYEHFAAPITFGWYEAVLGNVQSSFAIYARIDAYLSYLAVTLPASIISLWLFDRLTRCQGSRRTWLITFGCWELSVVLVCIAAYELEWAYRLNQIAWRLFGSPENLYSFCNLDLPHLVVWVLTTTPICILALWAYSKRAARRRTILQSR